MDKFERIIFYVVSAILVGFLITLLVILYYPFKVIKLVENPLPVINKTVVAGEPVSYIVHVIKYKDTRAEISRRLVCGDDSLYISSGLSSYSPGEIKSTSYLDIPSYAPVGKCRISLVLKYHLYFFRDISYTFLTEEFNVIAPPDTTSSTVSLKTEKLITQTNAPVILTIPSQTPLTNNTSTKETTTTTTTNNTTTQTPAPVPQNDSVVKTLIDKLL